MIRTLPSHVPDMLSVAAAKSVIAKEQVSLTTECVALRCALGRVLAEDVRAAVAVPPFSRAAMDGYAVRREDVACASRARPARLRVDGSIMAGSTDHVDSSPQIKATAPIGPGCARRIATGAMIPPGADGVVPLESTRPAGSGMIDVIASIERRSNVSPQGEEYRVGDVVARAGVRLGPDSLGAIASVGRAEVQVFAKPKVAILATGDEVRDVGAPLGPGQVYNSGFYALCASVERDGGSVIEDAVIVPDDLQAIRRAIERAQDQGADLVLTTGGVSVGDRDFVPEAILGLGGRILFWRVRMRPGKACAFASLPEGRHVFALSGNPAAAMVSYEVLVRPHLLRRCGESRTEREAMTATLADSFPKASPQERYLRGRLHESDGRLVVSLASGQQAGHFRSWMQTNALVVVPAGSGPLSPGDTVEVFPLSIGASR